jgi:alanine-synthesizing transaminase
MQEFQRMKRLPPYMFAEVNKLKAAARQDGEDIIDLGMGNPDLPTSGHIVDKLVEASHKPVNHRYSASRGITKLRHAISAWYQRRYAAEIDPDREAVVTMGVKEGLTHLILATVSSDDVVLVPNPTYPIHLYSVVIAGGDLRSVPLLPGRDFFAELMTAFKHTWPHPKMLIISFPHNPTTMTVDMDFMTKLVEFCREHQIWLVHDFAYADLCFDGYRAPSVMQVPGAKEVAVEFFSMSKSYSMPGWRLGFCVGNPEMVAALTKIKSYLDYGVFQPIQIAGIIALNEDQSCVEAMTEVYRRRRDALVNGLNRIGWEVETPLATMFLWARIPEKFRAMGSIEFSKKLIKEARVAVSPGIGFGEYGDEFVRMALVENEQRINQAVRGIRRLFNKP